MKNIIVLMLFAITASAQNTITFTNKESVTFTNLEGTTFKEVRLVRADLDGLIWLKETSGGRICYTNLAPDWLESIGISSNRIDVALARARHKTAAFIAQRRAESEANAKAQAEWAAGAPARAKADALTKASAQQQVDLQQLQAAQARIDALDTELRHAQAMAIEDQKRGGNSYIKDTAVEQLNDLHKQLDRMAAQYKAKYGEIPAGIETGVTWGYTR